MTNKEFMQEGMDLKRLFLCLKKKLGLILLMTVIGVLLGMLLYQWVRFANMRIEWQTQSQFYMQFIYRGDVEQSYNGYTWNDLLHGDPVIDKVMEAMGGDSEGAREMVREAIEGKIISDIRLLTVNVTAAKPDLTIKIQKAVEEGLLAYAAEQAEIISMDLIRSTEPARVLWDDRTTRAAVSGGVLFLVISLFGWIIYYILDDSLYVIADSEKRYPFPLLGMLVKTKEEEGYQPYAGVLAENVAYLLKDVHKLAFLSVAETNGIATRTRLTFDRIITDKVTGKSWETVVPELTMTGETGEIGESLRDTDGVILVVPFGNRNGKMIDRTISFLRNQDCKIQGIIIADGDERFWKCYYGSKKEKADEA